MINPAERLPLIFSHELGLQVYFVFDKSLNIKKPKHITSSIFIFAKKMKMKSITAVILTTAILSFGACKEAKKTVLTSDEVSTNQSIDENSTEFKIDSASSIIEWEGSEGLASINTSHNGTFALSNGTLMMKNDSLTGGKFEINIASLKVLDIPIEKAGNAKLKKHLLSPDFFDQAKFPNATFEISSINKNTSDSGSISGNLTLKGITKNIDILAKITNSNSEILFETGKFYINRNDWNMSYGTEKSLGDEMIRPEVGIKIKIVAKK